MNTLIRNPFNNARAQLLLSYPLRSLEIGGSPPPLNVGSLTTPADNTVSPFPLHCCCLQSAAPDFILCLFKGLTVRLVSQQPHTPSYSAR